MFAGLMHTFLSWLYLSGIRSIFSVSRLKIHEAHVFKEGIESFQIGKDKTGSDAYDTVYIKDINSVAVSSGFGGNACIDIIDIERIWLDLVYRCGLMSANTCRGFLRLSLFALRL
jgi:hypothetical protein